MRNYEIVTPSLTGVLSHDSLSYEGIKRPLGLFKILDSGLETISNIHKEDIGQSERKELQRYFQDLSQVFLRKYSSFVIGETGEGDSLKMRAILNELIKIRKILD